MRLITGAEHERFMRELETERERQRNTPPMLRYRMQRIDGTPVVRVVCTYARFTNTKLVPIGPTPYAFFSLITRLDRDFEDSNRPHPSLPE